MNYKFIILLISLNILKSFAGQCSFDWQCPNLPNSYCRNKLIVQSNDIAVHDQRVYFVGRYSNDDPATAHANLLSVPFQPNLNDKYRQEFQFQGEDFSLSYARYGGIMGYEMNNNFFMTILNRFKNQPYLGFYLGPFNNNGVSSHVFTALFEGGSYQKMYFDSAGNQIYRCQLGNLQWYSINPDIQKLVSGRTLYKVYCEGVWLNGDNLYWTSRDPAAGNFSINFHIGNKNVPNNQPNVPTTIGENEEVYAFTGSNTDIIYSTKDALYKMAIPNGQNIPISRQLITNDPWIESAVYKDGFVYYTTSNSYIKKVNLQNNQVTVLYEPNDYSSPKPGNCTCRYGFSGDNCDVCPPGNQIIWDNNGSPSCRPYGYCIQEYQCNNVVPSFNFQPFATCYMYNQCICKISYLTYPNCDKCPNGQHIAWENNSPQCVPN
ncbi:EGF-like domain-containing protein [Tieghemostelium lacteum]|uniref:EGF-like domain-containing protein n=1 Tax=Tieghemostelium lacteum TaxID=361077 RepID=A0A152A7G4_TIELA|nr:EGF-like domain-containing protein [Tieghemostelium lacteum]|eukprot:KYR02183.1 EGF-like domain-containing protein [Tieghemostelium lacteum]